MRKDIKYKDKLIKDDGIVEKKNVLGTIVSICSVFMSAFLVVLGILAYVMLAFE